MPTNPYIRDISLVADVRAIRRGELPLSGLIERLEERFHLIEPAIESYLPETNRFDRLRREAETLEARHPDPALRPPLFGALLGVKDIFHVDGFVTRAGTQVPAGLFAGTEAAVVTRLKNAGALIVGKTVTTEFAFFEPGPTRNPHNPDHTPGGSSSGSAASVASGLAHVTTGTQTIGSVIRPAAYCGVVGFKPSYGRVDSAGLVDFSRSADHVGFFTQDIPDMQAVASATIDDWNYDRDVEARPILAVPTGAYLEQSTALDGFEAQLYVLEQAGYPIRRVPMFDDIAAIDARHQDLTAAELAIKHREWFAQYSDLYRPRTAALIRKGQSVSSDRLLEVRQHRLNFRERVHRRYG